MKKQDIIYCIEHSGISKERLRKELEDIRVRAEYAVNNPNGVFYGQDKTVEDITFYWFKNWLHPILKHRTRKPDPNHYDMTNPDELKEFNEL